MSCYKIKFWTDKGYSEKDALYQISIRRIYNKNYWIHKYGEKQGLLKYYDFITKGTKGKKQSKFVKAKNKMCIEYWLNKGFSYDESKKEQGKYQSKFSLDSCIKKYGKEKGKKIFLERQKKWQTTLSNKSHSEITDINNKKKRSLKKIIEENKENWLEFYIKEKLCKNTEITNIAKLCLRNFSSQTELIENFKNYSKLYKNAYRVLRLEGIKYKFNIDDSNINDVYLKIIKTYGIKNYKITQYGCKINHNGISFKSEGEYEIAKFLETLNYSYEYEKKYPNQSKYYYDFFIKDLNLYVEYTGMEGKKNYDSRLIRKRKMILNLGYNVLFSKNLKEIKEKILSYDI